MSRHGVALAGGGEFDRIRQIVAALGDSAGVIGDDTAAVPKGIGQLVTSIDVSVENVHFRREWITPREIGYRAAAAALSDLAAAAAIPAGLTVALTVPSGTPSDDVVALMAGVGDAARAFDAKVLGGDLSAGSLWSVSVSVFGHSIHPMSRAGAKAGDLLWVTGALGGAGAAVAAWQRGDQPDAAARTAFVSPPVRTIAAQWLAGHGATAMMDVSDGIAGDVRHVAAASAVRITVDLGALPCHASAAAAARIAGVAPAEFAATAGEDYELLVAMPRNFDGAVDFTLTHRLPMTCIGTITAGDGEVVFTLDGVEQELSGFRHSV